MSLIFLPCTVGRLPSRGQAEEIAYLERKLGLRGAGPSGARSRLAKEFEDDGLGGDFVSFLDVLDQVFSFSTPAPTLPGSMAGRASTPFVRAIDFCWSIV
jgi:hypothetical protein